MFNALGQIFSPPRPRQTEHADTRQDIQRHDPDYERRRKKQHKSESENLQQDPTTLSVDALLLFLKAFVKNNPPTARYHHDQIDHERSPVVKTGQTTSFAGQAASAYQNTASAQHKHTILLETTDTMAQGPEMRLGAEDIRAMLVLIDDIEKLKQAQIAYIQLEPAPTFLQALINATNKAKSYL